MKRLTAVDASNICHLLLASINRSKMLSNWLENPVQARPLVTGSVSDWLPTPQVLTKEPAPRKTCLWRMNSRNRLPLGLEIPNLNGNPSTSQCYYLREPSNLSRTSGSQRHELPPALVFLVERHPENEGPRSPP